MTEHLRTTESRSGGGARELTSEELALVAGGSGFEWGEFFRTVGRDIETSLDGAAHSAAVASKIGIGPVNLGVAVNLGAASAGLGFGLVHGVYEGMH